MMNWTMNCLNKQRATNNELIRDRMYGIDFSDIPSRVAEAWESGKYYHVSVDGPCSNFFLTNSRNFCLTGDYCYLMSTALNEGHIKKVGDKFTVRYYGEEEPHGEYDSLEEAIRSFNHWWRA